MFAVKRCAGGSTLVALTASSSTPAQVQGYFTATVLVLTAFDGFTVSPTTNQNDDRTPRNKLTQ
jgi:hypothetical protein